MASIGSLTADLRLESASFIRDMGKAQKSVADNTAKMNRGINQVATATQGLERQAASMRRAFTGIGAAVAAMGIGLVVRDIVRVSTEFQKLQASLKTVTGSTQAASAAFVEIKQFAATTPFDLQQVTSAFIKLKSLGLDPSMQALRSYGNTAAAMGKDLNQFIEAVADAATGEFERLKEFGIKSKSEGDKVTFTFRGMATTIGKNATEIEGFLRNIGETDFSSGMSDQMATLGGALSNIADSVAIFKNEIGEGGLSSAVADAARAFATSADGAHNAARQIGEVLGGAVRVAADAVLFVVENFRAFAAGLAAIVAFKAAAFFIGTAVAVVKLAQALLAARSATVALTVAMMANPIGLIAVAISAAIAALILFHDKTITIGSTTIEVGRVMSAVWTTVVESLDVLTMAIGYVSASLAALAMGDTELLGDIRRAATADIRESIHGIRDAWSSLSPVMSDTGDVAEELAATADLLSDATSDLAVTTTAATDDMADLIAKLTLGRDQTRLMADAVGQGDAAMEEANIQIEIWNALLSAGAGVTSDQAVEIANLIRETHGLEGAIDAVTDAQKAAAQASADYIAESIKAGEEAQSAREREADKAQELFLQPFKSAISSIQGAFSSMFEDIFSGGVTSFSDMAAVVKRIMIKLAAEVASLLAFRPVVGGILSAVGLPGTASALTGSVGGGGGGLGSLVGGGIPGNPTSFFGSSFDIGSSINSFGGNIGFATAAQSGAVTSAAFGPGAIGPHVLGSVPGAGSASASAGMFGGATFGQFLGGAGAGFGAGMFTNSLLGGNQTGGMVGSAIGATAGAIVGSIIPVVGTMAGGIIGGMLGGAVGGLFGAGKGVGPNAAARIVGNDAIGFQVGGSGADNGGDVDAAIAEAKKAVEALNKIRAALDLSITSPSSLLPGRNFVGSGGAASRGFKSAEAFVDAFLKGGGFSSDSAAMNAVLKGSTAKTLQENITLLSQVPGLLGPVTSAFDAAMTAVNDNFDDITDKAKQFGLEIAKVDAARDQALTNLRIQAQAPFLDQAAGIVGFLNSQALSSASSLSPSDRLAEAERQYQDILSRVTNGEQGLGGALTQTASNFLSFGRSQFSSTSQFANIESSVRGSLLDVASTLSSEDFFQEQIEATRQQTEVLAGGQESQNALLDALLNEIKRLRLQMLEAA